MFGGTRRGRLTALTPVLVVVLAGCTGDPEPIEPSGSPSPSATTSPSPGAEGPPSMPALATEHTEAGAIAFVEHYIEVFNYAANTGDVEPLRDLSHPDCEGCESYAASFEEKYEAGGYNKGFEWTIIDPIVGDSVVETTIIISQYTVLDDARSKERIAEGSQHEIGFELTRDERPIVTDIYRIAS